MGDVLKDQSPSQAGADLCERLVLLDDDNLRVTYFNFGPGQENPYHSHPYDFVVVTLDDGTFESKTEAGEVSTIPAYRNNFYRVPAGNRHRAQNIGDQPIRLVEVEMKNTDIRSESRLQVLDLKAEIVALECQRKEAMLAGDVEALTVLLDEKLVYTHSDGSVQDRQRYLSSLADGSLAYHRITLTDQEVHAVGTDTVIVTGVMEAQAVVDGGERPVFGRFTATWLRAQGKWRLVGFSNVAIARRGASDGK